jgi:hypothetical protein
MISNKISMTINNFLLYNHKLKKKKNILKVKFQLLKFFNFLLAYKYNNSKINNKIIF